MWDIRNILEQLDERHKFNFELMFKITKLGNNAERKDPYYRLTKKDCLLLASGYDANLRAKIINRWEDLETGKANPAYQVPSSFSEALMLAAQQQLQIEEQQKQISVIKNKRVGHPSGRPTQNINHVSNYHFLNLYQILVCIITYNPRNLLSCFSVRHFLP